MLVVGLLLVAAGCGHDVHLPRPPSAAYADPQVTWAQGGTIHYGERTIHVGGTITRLWRTAYGFVIGRMVGSGFLDQTAYGFTDGHHFTRFGGDIEDVEVSPDGRYVGWLDFDGRLEPTGRLADAVVVDLRTGHEVLRTDRDMGGASDNISDLYEDSNMDFLGFDHHYAYWVTPKGKVKTHRARLGTWTISAGAHPTSVGPERPLGTPYDELVGEAAGMQKDGRISPDGDGPSGFVSPDRHWCVTERDPRSPKVVDCRTARSASPAYPTRFTRFGGWLGPDDFLAVSTPRPPLDIAEAEPDDHQPGTLESCALPGGTCTVLRHVQPAATVTLPVGQTN